MGKRGKNRSQVKPQSQQLKVNTMSTKQQQSTPQKGNDETKKYTIIGVVIALISGFLVALTLLYPIVTGVINVKVEDYEKRLEKLITTGAEINERNAKDSLRIVALISDFGVGSYYMQVIKGKILQKNKRVNIVDITHAVKPFDEIEGAWILHNATKHLPEETIIWGMVNQGAKLSDNSIFFVTKNPKQYFIGASRSLFDNVIANQELEAAYKPNLIDGDDKYGTTTFTELVNILQKGGTIKDLIDKNLIKKDPLKYKPVLKTIKEPIWNENSVSGYVCSIDNWGNLLTNIKLENSFFKVGKKYSIKISSSEPKNDFVFGESYSAGEYTTGVIIEQDDWIQVAIYCKRANEYFGVNKAGCEIVIRKEN